MTEQGSTVEESTALVTTTEVTQHATTGSDKTSSLSDGIGFYFQCAVVVIGVIGTAANALILYALVASKQHKKHILIVNINALDLLGCVSLVITYSVKLCNIRLTGTSGYWLCVMILSENFVWWGVTGSRISLAIITIDRYLKVVHSAWSKKKLRNWMIYSAMAFSWSSPLIYCVTMAFTTTAVINGVCYAAVMWDSQVAKMIHIIWNVTSFYVIIILIIIFCYWRILVVIRRQASAMATHSGPGPSTAQTQSQWSRTKHRSDAVTLALDQAPLRPSHSGPGPSNAQFQSQWSWTKHRSDPVTVALDQAPHRPSHSGLGPSTAQTQSQWPRTKHRSDPVTSDADQRYQDDDPCERILRYHWLSHDCLLPTVEYGCECVTTRRRLLRFGFPLISVQLHQPVYLRHQV